MNLRYKILMDGKDYVSYDINCPNTFFYSHFKDSLPDGTYKGQLFGLFFWYSNKRIENILLGIKIDY